MRRDRSSSMIFLPLTAWLFVAIACASALPTSTPPPEVIPPPSVTALPAALPTLQTGEMAEQSGYSLSVTQIEYPKSTDAFDMPEKGYRMVAVEIILSNISGVEPLNVFYSDAYLVDGEGYVYKASYGYENHNLDMVDLGIGEKVKGWVNFIIPESAVPAYIKYKIETDIVLIAFLAQE